MTKRLELVIARRKLLCFPNLKENVVVTLGKPRKVTKEEWVCPYQICGMGDKKVQEAHGIDAFQALMMALEGIRVKIKESEKTLIWEGGEQGDIGFPRFLPNFYGPDFSRKIERVVDREIQLFEKAWSHVLNIKTKLSPQCPIPIPPLSLVEIIKADRKTPAWKNQIGIQYRIGYYSPNDGLDVIWLVDDEGRYGETTDHEFLFKYFKIIRLSRETDFFGIRRRRMAPLKKAVPKIQ